MVVCTPLVMVCMFFEHDTIIRLLQKKDAEIEPLCGFFTTAGVSTINRRIKQLITLGITNRHLGKEKILRKISQKQISL
jgi:hypothetical protein